MRQRERLLRGSHGGRDRRLPSEIYDEAARYGITEPTVVETFYDRATYLATQSSTPLLRIYRNLLEASAPLRVAPGKRTRANATYGDSNRWAASKPGVAPGKRTRTMTLQEELSKQERSVLMRAQVEESRRTGVPLSHEVRLPHYREVMGIVSDMDKLRNSYADTGSDVPAAQTENAAERSDIADITAGGRLWSNNDLALGMHPVGTASAPIQGKSIGQVRARAMNQIDISAASNGEPLPGQVRAMMETALGMDFSAVRIHVGRQAGDLGARAFTHGTNIFFAPGQYQPFTKIGQELLAHELTHVVQQARGRVRPTKDMVGMAINNDATLEREADEVGSRVAHQTPSPAPHAQHAEAPAPATSLHGAIHSLESNDSGPIQRSVDYDALAQRLYEEEQEITYDVEDVIAVVDQLPPGGLQHLIRAYSLKSRTPLVMVWEDRLYEGEYRQVMERVTGIRVADGADAVAANTTESGYNLRAGASISAANIGELRYSSMQVEVNGKGTGDDLVWYKIQFNETDYAVVREGHAAPDSAQDLIDSREAWVTGDALGMFVRWPYFIAQMEAFDIMTYDESLQDKVTMLRQMAHPEDLPFDDVIGTGAGDYYESDRPDLHSFYQLLKGPKAIQTPNGEIIDIYHFIVGLDAYQSDRRREQASVTMNSDVGNSYAAATWAGDLGAAAADCLTNASEDYEEHLRDEGNHNPAALADYYYRSRAPESDLLADIDAWGAYQMVEDAEMTSITGLMQAYYGVQASGQEAFAPNRARALEQFFDAHGLTSSGGTMITGQNRDILAEQIGKFAVVWLQFRASWPWPDYDEGELGDVCDTMASKFLSYIEQLNNQYRNQ